MQIHNQNKTPNYDLVFEDVCKAISGRSNQVKWDGYTDELWTHFRNICSEGGVSPLLYWQFKDGDWPVDFPHQLVAEVVGQFYTTRTANKKIFTDLEGIVKLFNQNSLPVLLLKGAALVGEIYDDMGLRPMGDLDLLVHKNDTNAAYKLLEQLGFHKSTVELWPGTDQDFWHEALLTNEEGRVVEVHWNLIGSDYDMKAPPVEYLWTQKKEIQFVNSEEVIDTINEYVHIVFGCAHIALQHGFSESRLIWYYDIYRLLFSLGDDLDWGILQTTAWELGWCTSLLLVLEKVSEYFNFPLPVGFMTELSALPSPDRELISEDGLAHQRKGRAVQIISTLSWPYKIKFVIFHLFPSPQRMRFRYKPDPNWLWPLYYPYRWVFIIRSILFPGIRVQ